MISIIINAFAVAYVISYVVVKLSSCTHNLTSVFATTAALLSMHVNQCLHNTSACYILIGASMKSFKKTCCKKSKPVLYKSLFIVH